MKITFNYDSGDKFVVIYSEPTEPGVEHSKIKTITLESEKGETITYTPCKK